MLMKRVRRGCPSEAAGPAHGFPQRTFDDSNNAEEQARQDETAVQANRHLAALHIRRTRDELVFQVPVAHDGLFLAWGDSTCRSRLIRLCCRTRPYPLQ